MVPMMAIVFFSNPALWICAVALTIPLVIHLLTRRTPRTLVFPTLQFLRAAVARQSRIYQWRHLLLLLVRTMLLLLILGAFLKPVLMQGAGAGSRSRRGGRAQMILMDVSASMGYTQGGVSPFAQAQAAALRILDDFRAGDRVNLIRMGRTPAGSLTEPSDSLFLLRKDVQAARVTGERADISAALAEAVRQLKGVPDLPGQIFLISDFQRTNWSAVDFTTVGPEIELFFVPVGLATLDNCGVTDVTIRPAYPTAGEPVEVLCKVANYGSQPKRLPLQLHFADGESFKRELAIDPHATAGASFQLRFPKSGRHEGTLSIPEDGLAIDDNRYFTLTIADQVNVLLVTDEDRAGAASGSRFLERAIDPFLAAQQASARATVVRSGEINATDTARAQVIVLAGVQELPRPAAEVLLRYLRDGGSVAYFHVGGADSHNLKLLADLSEKDFVCPFQVTGQVAFPQQDKHSTWSAANFDHRILRKFKETGQLGDLKFYQYLSTERVQQRGQVLLQYDDGNIAMAETLVGAGTMLLCNFGCSLKQSDIARHPLFVPLVHEIIKGLRPGVNARQSFTVGDQCYMTADPVGKTDSVEFQDPAGKALTGSVDVGQAGMAVFFPVTDQCGFYRVRSGGKTIGSVAVNVDPLESNLEALDVAQLKDLAKTRAATSWATVGGSTGIEKALTGEPLWHYCLLGAIGLLCLERVLVLMMGSKGG